MKRAEVLATSDMIRQVADGGRREELMCAVVRRGGAGSLASVRSGHYTRWAFPNPPERQDSTWPPARAQTESRKNGEFDISRPFHRLPRSAQRPHLHGSDASMSP